jgi:DNA modification methylase
MTILAAAPPPPADRYLYWRHGPVDLYLGDALAVLASLPDESAHIVVTSPPYYGLRNYGVDGQYGLEPTPTLYVRRMREVFRQVRRVLRPDGTLWLVLGDSYSTNSGGAPTSGCHCGYRGPATARPGLIRPRSQDHLPPKNQLLIPFRVVAALQTDGWIVRQTSIWHKPNAMPESVADRPSCSHEYIFLLARSRYYHFNLDAIRVPLARPDAADGTRVVGGVHKGQHGGRGATARRRGAHAWGRPASDNLAATGHRHIHAHPAGRNPGSVWSISTRPFPGAHFAAYPVDIPQRAIAAGCPPGGCVLDPFSGAATTGLAALKSGCTYWGIDLNPDYHDLARARLATVLPDTGQQP